MSISDHALIGDLQTAGLVARDGSINFMCLPSFDSDACFAALLGTPEHGRWKIAPSGRVLGVTRRYRGRTMILETDFETKDGVVRVIDFMPIREGAPYVIRIIEGIRGSVPMRFDLRPRFANGLTVPRVKRSDGSEAAIAGPDALYLRGGSGPGAPTYQHEVTISKGQRLPYVLAWARPYHDPPPPIDPEEALRDTETFWEKWASQIRAPKGHEELVVRSLLTLKACTYRPSGAIVAAPTFGLPETPGGERNWDYRFCWVRDSVLTLHAFIRAGLLEEARAFGGWLAEAIGGAPEQLQIMYGIRGERRLTEVVLDWLPGYQGARPVRIGNGAYNQFQLDVLGEFAAVLYFYLQAGGKLTEQATVAMRENAVRVAKAWMHPDHGIWEMRGPKHHFTASKVSAWAAIDRWVRMIEEYKLPDDPAPWRKLRQEIFDDVCDKGFDRQRNTFTQYYGSKGVDASLLFIPLTGFLPASDPRVVGTVKAVEEELMPEGLVLRYRTEEGVDGLSGEEGVFLPCSFWLVDTYHLMGRQEEAENLFEKVAGLRNDVGLLAEEYLPGAKVQIGNFPQAFTHLTLVNAAYILTSAESGATSPIS
ncbi:glycoside hydrolase family 15 protein [Archangium lansingense]|uniref:Glycoside hydrolase family 15 protein n=1 Tax=Archangium lansingense TaxID=2995310 RepID=A0ABT4AA62_9BACT|nr:glycoside hydrolase family 15 protein [Archangium lansinium]MCY1078548.1 glycoside hydrolase family 15 protein [Archangium lansinium]